MNWILPGIIALLFVPVRGGCSCLMESQGTFDNSNASDAGGGVDGGNAVDAGEVACVPACGTGTRCIDGVCVADADCQDLCSPSAATCESDQVVDCVLGADGCYDEVVVESCGVRQSCTAGECLCTSSCTPGAVSCGSTGGLVPCLGPDSDGCTYWGPEEPCDNGLVCSQTNNACMPDTPPLCFAINECQYVGQLTCYGPADPIKYRLCEYGADGCLWWDCTT